jgi:hypothetical protein
MWREVVERLFLCFLPLIPMSLCRAVAKFSSRLNLWVVVNNMGTGDWGLKLNHAYLAENRSERGGEWAVWSWSLRSGTVAYIVVVGL